MNKHFETPRDRFKHLKRQVLKIYPDATTRHNTDGSFSVLNRGENPITDRYPDLQTAPSVNEAWNNLKTVEHWQRIEDRNNRGFIVDKSNLKVEDYIVEESIAEDHIYEPEKED